MLAAVTLLAFLQLSSAQQCGRPNPGPAPAPPRKLGHPMPYRRPPLEDRTFSSPAVEKHLQELSKRSWRNPDLAALLLNCLPNTLDTTVQLAPEPGKPEDTFIITGDNKAMWLRDSACQVSPYLRFAKQEPGGIGSLLRGLIHRHAHSVLLDPYANSFNLVDDTCPPNHPGDLSSTKLDDSGNQVAALSMGIADRKWEEDSVFYVLRLGRLYYNYTEDTSPFDTQWRQAVRTIYDTLRAMQKPLTPLNFTKAPYTYQKSSKEPKDTQDHGIGKPHRYTGMIRAAFLPSDDAVKLTYHIPGNAMAVVELRETAKILQIFNKPGDAELAGKLEVLAQEVDEAIRRHGVVHHVSGVKIYAQVVDGFGNYFFGDDANVPSLLSLPYIGYTDASDPLYLATRKLLLSNQTNPYYSGPSSQGYEGIGSEDASGKFGGGWIWPISLMMRTLTSTSDEEILATLQQLSNTAPDGLMHESFWYEDPALLTRKWFAWANSLFGELVLHLAETRPHLLFSDVVSEAGFKI